MIFQTTKMIRTITFFVLFSLAKISLIAQSPSLSAWLRNTTVTARHYVSGNSTPISDATIANVQSVKYTATDVYISTTGVPSYITGPFLDGNPSLATSQNAIFKFPLTPTQNTGTPTATTGGNIGIFINGVALFDYRDGVSWNNASQKLCGGPINPPCTGDGVWNRDAVVAEKAGFDCAKGHPAMGNYHHHQNPSAFNLDLNVISTVCNLYLADGLYTIDASQHSPLIGFAYDGFPIYGAYAYKNADGTGGITRMKSSYTLRNITTRNTYYTGTSVTAGPAVSTTYPLGYFREDYQYTAPTSAQPDYLDEHNGRFCVTPEYPSGTYAYFCTVDASHNSAYPYAVGPTFYGNKVVTKVTSIPGGATTYTGNILPVDLLDISAYLNNDKAILKWSSLSEKNLSYYEIEASKTTDNFKKIGDVKAVGNTTTQTNYSFIDESFVSEIKYYRLKQIDNNGTYSYSKIVSLNSTTKNTEIGIFPNPVADLLILQSKGINKASLEIDLYNSNGQIVKKQQFNQGSTICYIETANLVNGVYFVSVSDNSIKKVYKIIVQH